MASFLFKSDHYRPVASVIVRQCLQCRSDLNNATYLVVKKPRKDHAWQFPQGGIEPGESVSKAALRELEEECGSNLKVHLLDTEPAGIYRYRFSEKFLQQRAFPGASIGAEVSFLRANWISGQCQPDLKEIIDFQWVTKEKLQKYTSPDYFQAVKDLL